MSVLITNTEIEKRMEIERKVVRFLVREMKKAGWEAYAVNDGEALVKCATEKDVMEAVFSVEESWIEFNKTVGVGYIKRTAYIVLGNDGWDAIADNSLSTPEIPEDNFDAVMDGPVTDYCNKLEEGGC